MGYNIGVIPGDGTGPEVIREAIKVLDAVSKRYSIPLDYHYYYLGGEAYKKDGTLLPESILGELRDMDAILLGAIGHPDVRPGILEREILLKLRFELDLYINLRPVKLYEGVNTPIKDKGPKDIDFVVIRENTEGLYAGGGGFFKKGTPDEIAIQESINTWKGVLRCIRYAFEFCKHRAGKGLVTLCSKTNVLLYEGDLWQRVFEEVARDYPEIRTSYQHVDALCMWMIKDPGQYDVIVTNNMFGDIITDIGAVIQGGLGIAAGGNINPNGHAMFEPIGGSAPKYAGKGVINPLAAIMAGAMMLEYLGEKNASYLIESAVKTAIKTDLRSLDAGKMGLSTQQVGDLVSSYVITS